MKINNEKISGGLNEEKQIKPNTKINISYTEDLQMTHNYYIIYNKIEEESSLNFRVPLSHFCYFKVVNCYPSSFPPLLNL